MGEENSNYESETNQAHECLVNISSYKMVEYPTRSSYRLRGIQLQICCTNFTKFSAISLLPTCVFAVLEI